MMQRPPLGGTSLAAVVIVGGALLIAVQSSPAVGSAAGSGHATAACPPGVDGNSPAPALVAKRRIARRTPGSAVLARQSYAATMLPCRVRHRDAIVDPGYLLGRAVLKDVRAGQQLLRSDFTRPGADRGVTDRAPCAGPGFAPVPVFVATGVIRKGTPGAAVYVKRLAAPQTIPCYWRRRGAIAELGYLVGRVAKRDVFAGQQLTSTQFS